MGSRSLSLDKGDEKNAWMLIALVGVVGLIFGLITMLEIVYDPTYFSNRLGQSVTSFSMSYPMGMVRYSGLGERRGVRSLRFRATSHSYRFHSIQEGRKMELVRTVVCSAVSLI